MLLGDAAASEAWVPRVVEQGAISAALMCGRHLLQQREEDGDNMECVRICEALSNLLLWQPGEE